MMEMVIDMDNPAMISVMNPPGIMISGHFIEKFGYMGYRPNGTRDWLFTYTLSGEGVFRVDGEEFICRAGDFVILKPNTMHHYATLKGSTWNFIWIHFVPPTDWMHYFQLPEALKGLLYYHIELAQTRKRIIHVLKKVIDDNRNIHPLWEELALHSLEEIFLLIQQRLKGSQKSKLDPRVEEILNILTQKMKEPHCVEELAKTVNLSPSRLAHLFKNQTGDSIIETLIKIRIRHSARLLEFTSRKIADIATDIGFQDSFYFSRQFKAYYGMNPTSYRENMQTLDN
jgi:AraC family transcriptional regulator of arabinose operon